MKKRAFGILFVCLMVCLPIISQQQWYFSVDERYPAERKDMKDINRIMVVNNALTQPQDFGHTSIMDGVNQGNVTIDLSNGVLYCLFSATQSLNESGMFDGVELMDINQNNSTNYYSRNPLKNTNAEKLCTDYKVDALLILNQIILYDVLESFPVEDGNYYAYLQAYAQSHWTIHYAGKAKEVSFTTADTLLWESDIHHTRTQSLNQLPSRQEALLYLAKELGKKVGNSFVPTWETSRRYIYENESIGLGMEAFRKQKWDSAILLWLPHIEGKDKKTAAIAAANIAISYEMLGDYVSACDYAQRAIRLFGAWKTAYGRQQQANIRYYLAHLQERRAREGGL